MQRILKLSNKSNMSVIRKFSSVVINDTYGALK